MTLWIGVLVASAGCYLLKVGGMSVPERVLHHPLTERAGGLIPLGLLGALISVQVLGADQSLTVDARLPALGLALALVLLRAPFLVVVVAAAAFAALLRALGWMA